MAKVEVAVVEETFKVETDSPPRKVEVAFVEVAKYTPAVGVDVPTTLVPSNDSSELFESPEAFVPPLATGKMPVT